MGDNIDGLRDYKHSILEGGLGCLEFWAERGNASTDFLLIPLLQVD